VIVDTSVWIQHLQAGSAELIDLLDADQVEMHPHVLGELALGALPDRDRFLGWVGALRAAPVASDREVLELVERWELWGSGIGWVDAHLIAAARIGRLRILTADRRLAVVAESVGVR
jgi:predicted nucleic acid-binding protein